MKKVYLSKTYDVAGRTPDECLAKIVANRNEDCEYDEYENYSPIATVKIGKDFTGKMEYRGIYKAKEQRGNRVKTFTATIYGYEL